MRSLRPVLLLLTGLLLPLAARSQNPAPRPRLLALPWVVVDRTTNQDAERLGPAQAQALHEGRMLAESGQAALDGALHDTKLVDLVPRKEWEPGWKAMFPKHTVRQGGDCAVCTAPGQLIRFDRGALLGLAQSVHADYVWLGATVVPLVWDPTIRRADDCCVESIGFHRSEILVRTTAVLVRASDGEVVWQRDSRWPAQPTPRHGPRGTLAPLDRNEEGTGWTAKPALPPHEVREKAVDQTARALARAFRREFRTVMK